MKVEIDGIKYVPEKKEPYIFQAGDVAENKQGLVRIIIHQSGKLESRCVNGYHCSTGQERFEAAGYKKIGELSDLIK